jgi:hypothetical protein
MMDVNKYLRECRRMAQMKKIDENIAKVYADVDFNKLFQRCLDYLQNQEDIAYAEQLFNDVSQAPVSSGPIGNCSTEEMRYNRRE